MKKSTSKTTATATAKKSASNRTSAAAKQPLIQKQPQSKQQAALQSGMFLYTDDHWSTRYFDDADLHCLERKVLG
jgi:hypothetical protein